MDMRQYINDAIERLKTGKISSDYGSHLAGVYGKAAQRYEQYMRGTLEGLLNSCGVDYDSSIRSAVNGSPRISKLTLGQILFCFTYISEHLPSCVDKNLAMFSEERGLLEDIDLINRKWVDVKHGGGIGEHEALRCLRAMLRSLDLVEAY